MEEERLWYRESALETLKFFETDKEKGLTTEEAGRRLEKYGKNIFPKAKSKTIWQIFFEQFKSPIILILVITVILSFIIGEIIDAVFILIVILSDALL